MHIRDLHFESEKLESTESVDSSQAATVTSHTDWHIKSVSTVKRTLSRVLSPGRVQKEHEAFEKYYEQGKPRKSVYQTDLMESHQIWHIVV